MAFSHNPHQKQLLTIAEKQEELAKAQEAAGHYRAAQHAHEEASRLNQAAGNLSGKIKAEIAADFDRVKADIDADFKHARSGYTAHTSHSMFSSATAANQHHHQAPCHAQNQHPNMCPKK